MTETALVPLRRDTVDRRVRSLRERLVRVGTLSPRDDLPPARLDLFDVEIDRAVRAFQQTRGLIADGVVGPETERRLHEAQYQLGDRPLSWNPQEPLRGDDVERLQHNLSLLGLYYGHLTGSFDEDTHLAVLELQQNLGLDRTGRVDRSTIEALARITKNITDSKAFSLRDVHRMESATDAMRNRDVILVAGRALVGHPHPPGAPTDFSRRSSEIATDVACRTLEILESVGARPVVVMDDTAVRSHDRSMSTASSIEAALRGLHRPVVLVLDCEWNSSPSASGIATYYWGDDESSRQVLSPIGHRGASLILREMIARTGSVSLGSHGRQWDVLRSTPASTIALDLGYLSHPAEAEALHDPQYRSHIAQAIAVGLQRMFMQGLEGFTTGTMSASEIAQEVMRRPAI